MKTMLASILSQIKDLSPAILKKADLAEFFKEQAPVVPDDDLSVLFNDIFAFNAYLGRIEGYPRLNMIPFWEYSQCLEWAENHMLVGSAFDLTRKNAKRFLGNIKKYYEFLQSQGKLADSEELDKAIKTICGGKKLALVRDIPYVGTETYIEIYKGGVGIRFDIADYWLLILKATLFDEKWTKLLEAAMRVSTIRTAKVKDLQKRMSQADHEGLSDIAFNDVSEAQANRAKSWFYDPNG
jgi:hypothetical protein